MISTIFSKTSQPESSSSNVSKTSLSSTLLTRGTQTLTKGAGSVNNGPSSPGSQASFISGGSGTGQPVVRYRKLDFQTDALFAIGSPIGLFLTTR